MTFPSFLPSCGGGAVSTVCIYRVYTAAAENERFRKSLSLPSSSSQCRHLSADGPSAHRIRRRRRRRLFLFLAQQPQMRGEKREKKDEDDHRLAVHKNKRRGATDPLLLLMEINPRDYQLSTLL